MDDSILMPRAGAEPITGPALEELHVLGYPQKRSLSVSRIWLIPQVLKA